MDELHTKDKRITVIDDSESITLEELQEIKKLVSLSKATKIIAGIVFGVVGLLGLPTILSWVSKQL